VFANSIYGVKKLTRKRLIIIAAVLLALLAVVLLLASNLPRFNQRPELSFRYPGAILTNQTIAESCTWNNTMRGGTQGDFYDYVASASADEIAAFYEKDGATCQSYASPRKGVACRKDYGNSVSYSVYFAELPDQTTMTGNLQVEVWWAC
jgi:hypothetical protein